MSFGDPSLDVYPVPRPPIIYRLFDGQTMAVKSWLPDVISEPTLTTTINGGDSELQLQMGHDPALDPVMTDYDIVEVLIPDGREPDGLLHCGWWKFEMASADEKPDSNKYIAHCYPMMAELNEVDYEANWTDEPDPDALPQLGLCTFDQPIAAAVPRTRHCRVNHVDTDSTHYRLTFPMRLGRVVDALWKAVDMGGIDYWWWADGYGNVEVRHGFRRTVTLDYDTDCMWQTPVRDGSGVINIQSVLGGNKTETITVSGLTYDQVVPISGTYVNNNSSDPYSVPNVGRRVAQAWRDPGCADQAAVDRLGANLLARHGVPTYTRTLRLLPHVPPIYPGDGVIVDYGDGSHVGPWWVKQRTLYGTSLVQQVVLSSAIDFRARPYQSRSLAALNSGAYSVPTSGLGAGTGCGGYQPIARTLPGSSHGSSSGTGARLSFILDSGGNCQVDVRGMGSITGTAPGGVGMTPTASIQLLCDTDRSGTISTIAANFPLDGNPHPFALSAPSDGGLADGAYEAYLVIQGPDNMAWSLDYDVQAWLYAGGGGSPTA